MKKEELVDIYGGASWGVWTLIGGAVSFILGFLEGQIKLK